MRIDHDRREHTQNDGTFPFGIVLAAAAVFLLALFPLLPYRTFDPDEFEHAHAAWSVFRGMLPYRDFFEHHTPWYYYVLRPLFNWFQVDTSFDSARHFLVLGRVVSMVPTLLSAIIITRIGCLWQGGNEGRKLGLLAGFFVVSQPFFLQKAIEIRPDVFALPFFLGCLWFLLRGIAGQADATVKRGWWWFPAAGLSLGASIMFTQKMLFVLPGTLAGLGIWSLCAGNKTRILSRGLLTFIFLVGTCVPAALTWAAFALHDGGGVFIANNFLLNARWKETPTHQFRKLLMTSGPILGLSLVGAAVSLMRFSRSDHRWHQGQLLLCTLGGLFAGVLVIPSAHRQYYLLPLVIACLFAAKGLLFLIERFQERARARLVLVALTLLAILPGIAVGDAFLSRNDGQLAVLRQVFERTKATDLVMDGWKGTGVFRPHAFYYFFLHEETVAMLPAPRVEAYLDALESGAIRPRLIAMDENLASLGPRFLRFVAERYVSADGFLHFPK